MDRTGAATTPRMDSSKVDHLITEVQSRPYLWNPSDKDYKHKTKRDQAWLDIAEQLYPHFSTMDIAQQNKKDMFNTLISDIIYSVQGGRSPPV